MFIKVEADPRLQYTKWGGGLEDAINSSFKKYVKKIKYQLQQLSRWNKGTIVKWFYFARYNSKSPKKPTIHHRVNNSLLICVSILSDLHQQKNPRALCQGVPQFHMFPSFHRNISFLQNGKEAR